MTPLSLSLGRLPLIGLCLLVAVYLPCVLYVHFRGRVRHAWPRQLTDHSTFLAPYNAFVTLFSAVPRRAVLDPAMLPELAALTSHWREIREEALSLHDAGGIRSAPGLDDLAFNTFFKRGWTRFYVKWYGHVLPSAVRACPRTSAWVAAIPAINAALFAYLPPHSRLGKHRDPFAGSLRYHLGLVTPSGDGCRLYVDGQPHVWRAGEAFLFDETYVHGARNDADEGRLILFCDVARPLRTRGARWLNRFVTRRLMPHTAARNEPGDPLGVLNRASAPVFRAREALERFKKRHRVVHRAVKYGAMAAVGLALLGLALAAAGCAGRRLVPRVAACSSLRPAAAAVEPPRETRSDPGGEDPAARRARRRFELYAGAGLGPSFAQNQDLKVKRFAADKTLIDDLFSKDVDTSLALLGDVQAGVWVAEGPLRNWGFETQLFHWTTRAAADALAPRAGHPSTGTPPPFDSVFERRYALLGCFERRFPLGESPGRFAFVGAGAGVVHTVVEHGPKDWAPGAEVFAGLCLPLSERFRVRFDLRWITTHDADSKGTSQSFRVDTSGRPTWPRSPHFDTRFVAPTVSLEFTF